MFEHFFPILFDKLFLLKYSYSCNDGTCNGSGVVGGGSDGGDGGDGSDGGNGDGGDDMHGEEVIVYLFRCLISLCFWEEGWK